MFPLLFVLWVILNGRITLEIALIGIVLAVGLDFLSNWMLGHSFRQSYRRTLSLFGLYRYLPMLLRDMIFSAWKVLWLVLHPRQEIHPQLMYFKTGIQNENIQVLLADSITLTPGTITVELQHGKYRVHALDASFMEGIESCGLERELERLETRYGNKL